MNIDTHSDLDSSNAVNKMTARCSKIATVVYNNVTHTVTVTRPTENIGGIMPIFYPSTYSVGGGSASSFVWSAQTPSSTDRTFEAVPVTNGVVTVNVASYNNWNTSDSSKKTNYQIYMSDNTAANSYTVNSSTITATDKVTITNSSFTIDFSDSTAYPSGSTHRFYLQQLIPVDTSVVSSGNASPEYAYIQFTIQ